MSIINLDLFLAETEEDLLLLNKERKWILLKTILLCILPAIICLFSGVFVLFAYIINPITLFWKNGQGTHLPVGHLPQINIPWTAELVHIFIILIYIPILMGVLPPLPILLFKGSLGFFSNIISIFVSIKKSFWGDYNLDFKRVVIQKILSCINPTLTHFPLSQISEREFSYSYLLHSSEFNNITGDDLIEGKIHNTFIRFSEIQINRFVDGGEDAYKNSHQIWQGLFIIIDLPRNTNTAFGTSTNISDNKILLDNTEFNELFPVYAENTTEAFYILPSNLLERMVNFVRKTGRKFDFSVVDDKFYIAIPYNRELLEPPIFTSLFDYSIYEEYLTDLELAIGIVEDLKLA